MKTLLALLLEGYMAQRLEDEPASLSKFIEYSDQYLTTNRPRTVDYRIADNIRVTLTNGVEVVLSPLQEGDKPAGKSLLNVEQVGVSTSGLS